MRDLSISGPGSGGYYPVHVSSNGHSADVDGILAGNFTSIAPYVDAGCRNTE